MISMLRIGAIVFIATTGVASPVFAQGSSACPTNGAPCKIDPDYRLAPHHARHTGKLYMHHPITSKTVAQPNKNK